MQLGPEPLDWQADLHVRCELAYLHLCLQKGTNQLTVMCTARGERKFISIQCQI